MVKHSLAVQYCAKCNSYMGQCPPNSPSFSSFQIFSFSVKSKDLLSNGPYASLIGLSITKLLCTEVYNKPYISMRVLLFFCRTVGTTKYGTRHGTCRPDRTASNYKSMAHGQQSQLMSTHRHTHTVCVVLIIWVMGLHGV